MLCQLAGVEKNRLGRIITTFSGVANSTAYISAKRMRYAAQLLREHPDWTILHIATTCGIPNTSTFNRLFRQEYGVTPSKYIIGADEGNGALKVAALALTLFISMALAPSAQAQVADNRLHVNKIQAFHDNGKMHLEFQFSYSTLMLADNQQLHVSPLVKAADGQLLLTPLLFDGKSKKVTNEGKEINVVFDEKYGHYKVNIIYLATYQSWMQGAALCLQSELIEQGARLAQSEDCLDTLFYVNTPAELEAKRRETIAQRDYKLAVRTNLLLPLLNVGLELPIGNRWSIGADVYYPWNFRNSDHKWCFQLLAIDLEGRYWFGEKHKPGKENRRYRLQGHSVGAFLASGKYDFEKNYKGDQGEFWVAGADYLYATPIFKGWAHLEFSLAVGFIRASAYNYTVYTRPGGKGYYDDKNFREVTKYFGPVKGTVALVIPLKFKKF